MGEDRESPRGTAAGRTRSCSECIDPVYPDPIDGQVSVTLAVARLSQLGISATRDRLLERTKNDKVDRTVRQLLASKLAVRFEQAVDFQ